MVVDPCLGLKPIISDKCMKEDDVGVADVESGMGEDREWDVVVSARCTTTRRGLRRMTLVVTMTPHL